MASYEQLEKFCSEKDCENSYLADRWGSIRALSDGWFLQRNGKTWCPDHIPGWVAEWRKKKEK